MNTLSLSAPIIIMGMHRSGTTLITKMLEICDVFWGKIKDEYNEDRGFQLLNEQLFSVTNGTWDNPEPVENHLSETRNVEKEVAKIKKSMDTYFYKDYFGCREPFLNAQTQKHSIHWGWKDPRNIFTLPVWLRVFPSARVIHILRNGVDVTASLWRRETSRPEGSNHPHYSILCQSLIGCFNLWKCYVTSARYQVKNHENAVEIRFEDLIEQPAIIMRQLADFLGLELNDLMGRAISMIKPERRFAFVNTPNLQNFWHLIKNDSLMNELGYSCLPE
jgi:hypothetical protein